jgi:hypothetical protein
MNQDAVGFNPAPFVAIVMIGIAAAWTYRRTGSIKKAAIVAIAVKGGQIAVAAVAHLMGFE